MFILESNLRRIIREQIIAEGFLDSKVESLRAIEFRGERYDAAGYGDMQGEVISTPVVIFSVPKGKKVAGKPLEGPFPFKVKNSGTSFEIKRPLKYHYMPIETPGLKFSSERLDVGVASGADWTIEIAGIVGGIPAIGTPADIGASLLAVIKDPPDYLIAAISLICALPVIGLGAAAARPILRKIGRGGGKEVGQKLGEVLMDQGVELTPTVMTTIRKRLDALFNTINQKSRLKVLAAAANKSSDEMAERLGDAKSVVDEIVDNMKVVGTGSRHGVPVVAGLDDFSRAIVRKTTAKVIGEVTGGQIRNACARWAKQIARDLPDNPQLIIGKEFTIPQIGKKVVFKSENDLVNTFFQSMKTIGITGQDAANLWKEFYEGTVRSEIAAARTPSPAQIDSMADMLVQKMGSLKINIVETAEEFASEARTSSLVNGLFDGGPPPQVFINFEKFGREGLEKNMQEIVEHEIIHGVDKMMLSVLSGGDKAIEALFKRKGVTWASSLSNSGVLRSAEDSGKELSRYIFDKSSIRRIVNSDPDNLAGLTDWQAYLVRGGISPEGIAYVSDPAEMFVRAQRISYWLKRNGFRPDEWDKFFLRSADDMIEEVPDADFFRPFFGLFKEVATSGATSGEKFDLGVSIWRMLSELV